MIEKFQKTKPTPPEYKVKRNDFCNIFVYDVIWPVFGVDASYLRYFCEMTDEGASAPGYNLRINCEGGHVFAAWGMVNYLLKLGKPVHTYVDGMAASAASLLSVAGTERYAYELSAVMVHGVNVTGTFSAKDMQKALPMMAQLQDQMIPFYAKRTKWSESQVRNLMEDGEDHYFYGTDLIKQGLVDKVLTHEVDGKKAANPKAAVASSHEFADPEDRRRAVHQALLRQQLRKV